MILFYSPENDSGISVLDEQESKHCIKVLRLSNGDKIHLTDGRGNLYQAELFDANPRRSRVKILNVEKDFGKREFKVHIAVAPTKNISRFEWFLEKSTEIGIDEITPIICEHSERKIIKTERQNKILIGAMKQSIKAFLPVFNEQISFDQFLKKSFPFQKYIAYYDQNNPELMEAYTSGDDVCVLIGPEGDFSDQEIDSAKKVGFIPVNLGKNRLRTETAALVACHTINLLNT